MTNTKIINFTTAVDTTVLGATVLGTTVVDVKAQQSKGSKLNKSAFLLFMVLKQWGRVQMSSFVDIKLELIEPIIVENPLLSGSGIVQLMTIWV